MAHCLRTLKALGADIELFACWEGDQSSDPEFSETRSVVDFEDPTFEFREGRFVAVR